jgi:hypothetical protein
MTQPGGPDQPAELRACSACSTSPLGHAERRCLRHVASLEWKRNLPQPNCD